MKSWSLFLLFVLLSACAHAEMSGILDGKTLQPALLQDAVQNVMPGSIVVIGENHGIKDHQNQQIEIMTALRARGLKVSVGMEFFTYTHQDLVNAYRAGTMSEADFLAAINWGNPSFDFYRDQTLFPDLTHGGQTIALNAPRSLTSKVAKQGLDVLTEDERGLLPPSFTLGRDSYKQRFLGLMPHLPSQEAGDRYFAAQSIWDDTMAWKATGFIQAHPDHVLVIVVGDFHVQFGGGLPDRIRARSNQISVLTFSQVNTEGLSADEVSEAIAPSLTEGPRADFLWLAPAKSLGI